MGEFMGLIAIFAGAIAAYAFGSVWYMALARPWRNASGLTDKDFEGRNPVPFIIAFVCVLIVSFMMQYLNAQLVLLSPVEGLLFGLAVGLFLVVPWVATNYIFGKRPKLLIVIDGTYAVVGCGIIGAVQGLF